MPTRRRWSLVLAIVGLVAILIGAIDPLEGSLIILPGDGLLAFAAWLGQQSPPATALLGICRGGAWRRRHVCD